MDCCARGLKAAAKMVEDKALSGPLEERYAGWKSAEGKAMLSGKRTLEEIAERVVKQEDRAAAEIRPPGTAGEHRQPVRVRGSNCGLAEVWSACQILDGQSGDKSKGAVARDQRRADLQGRERDEHVEGCEGFSCALAYRRAIYRRQRRFVVVHGRNRNLREQYSASVWRVESTCGAMSLSRRVPPPRI